MMTRNIDQRFLSVHPRTALWWEQRAQCEACAHMQRRGSAMNCFAVGGDGNDGDSSCITARDKGGRCGPDALLFQPIA